MRAVRSGKDGDALMRPWFDDRLVRVVLPWGAVGTGVALENGDVAVFGKWLTTVGAGEFQFVRDVPDAHKRAWLIAYYEQSVRWAQLDVEDEQRRLDAWSAALVDAEKEVGVT